MDPQLKKIIISQSLIKALDRSSNQCPARAFAIYFLNMKQEPSRAMNLGNYFETIVFGSTEDGEVIRPELNQKTGEPLTDYVRVRKQATDFIGLHRDQYQMNMEMPRVHLTMSVPGYPGYQIRCRLDMITSLYDKSLLINPFMPRVILDTKMTGSLDSSFGPFTWKTPEAMDHLQMDLYSMAYKANHGTQIPSYYFVMEYGPQQRTLLLRKEVTEQDMKNAESRAIICIHLIEEYFRVYGTQWPKVPDPKNCKKCPLALTCASAILD